jgi:hypothetical protein
MRQMQVAIFVALVFAGAPPFAQGASLCNGLQVLKGKDINALFAGSGQYTCGSFNGESWNELHANGSITDYKKGPTDRVDPSVQVGTYSVAMGDVGQLTDQYGGANDFSYNISQGAGTTYYYCGVSGNAPTLLTITIQPSHC